MLNTSESLSNKVMNNQEKESLYLLLVEESNKDHHTIVSAEIKHIAQIIYESSNSSPQQLYLRLKLLLRYTRDNEPYKKESYCIVMNKLSEF